VAGPSRIFTSERKKGFVVPLSGTKEKGSVSARSQQGARVLASNGHPLRPSGLRELAMSALPAKADVAGFALNVR
jgi:hypothetical protein